MGTPGGGRIDADDDWLIDSNYNKAKAAPLPAVSMAWPDLPAAMITDSDDASAYERLTEPNDGVV